MYKPALWTWHSKYVNQSEENRAKPGHIGWDCSSAAFFWFLKETTISKDLLRLTWPATVKHSDGVWHEAKCSSLSNLSPGLWRGVSARMAKRHITVIPGSLLWSPGSREEYHTKSSNISASFPNANTHPTPAPLFFKWGNKRYHQGSSQIHGEGVLPST